MTEKRPLVSVIIPVYNVEEYLRKCLESVLRQSYDNLEIIIIDDGSTDKSPEICDEYASRDNRMKVIHKDNAGVSTARNTGLLHMQGRFLAFVDSDDEVYPDYIAAMVDAMQSSNTELVISNMEYIYESQHRKKVTHPRELSGRWAEDYVKIGKWLPNTWGKLYVAALVKQDNICFKESLSVGEDEEFNLRYYCHVNKYIFINTALYKYYIRKRKSLTTTGRNKAWVEDIPERINLQKNVMKQCNIKHSGKIMFRMILGFTVNIGCDESQKQYRRRMRILTDMINQYDVPDIELKKELWITFMKHGWYMPLYLFIKLRTGIRRL